MPHRFALTVLSVAVLSVVLAASTVSAERADYDFADPKQVNGIVFILDSELEPFVGLGGGVSGLISYDPDDPRGFDGSISVQANALTLVNPKMTDVMHSDTALSVSDNVQVTVEFDEVVEAEPADTVDGNTAAFLVVKGRVLFAGLEVEKEFEIMATHVPDGASERGGAKSGDLLVLRSEFTVTRTELGIMTDTGPEKVAEAIHVIVPIVGYSK